MTLASPFIHIADYRELGVWLISILLVVFGFRYFKEILVFVLEKLYELFIQQNPSI